jgi:hypothetical protein
VFPDTRPDKGTAHGPGLSCSRYVSRPAVARRGVEDASQVVLSSNQQVASIKPSPPVFPGLTGRRCYIRWPARLSSILLAIGSHRWSDLFSDLVSSSQQAGRYRHAGLGALSGVP